MSIATTRKQLLLSLALISLFSACFAGPPPASTTDYCLNEDGGNCPAGFVCVDNSCAALCQSSLDCESPLDACLDGYCAPYMSICDVSAECAEGWYCDTDVCRKKQNNGVVCGSDSEVCASNFCIDGVCCEALCDDSCVACAEILTGVENGKCQNTLEGEDPRDDCPGPLSCNGDGECFTLAQGNSCSDNFECSTGHCADGICCDAACDGACASCIQTDHVGECLPLVNMLDPGLCDAENQNENCNSDQCICDTNGSCENWLLSQCETSDDCSGASCFDGYCCYGACEGGCYSCNSVYTGTPNGTCAPILENYVSPESNCEGFKTCNGMGECWALENGEVCSKDRQCSSHNCCSNHCTETSCV